MGEGRLAHDATSLGGVESLIEYRHKWDSAVSPRLLRLSVGLPARSAAQKARQPPVNQTATPYALLYEGNTRLLDDAFPSWPCWAGVACLHHVMRHMTHISRRTGQHQHVQVWRSSTTWCGTWCRLRPLLWRAWPQRSQTDVLPYLKVWLSSMREKLRCRAMHFKTTASCGSCAMLFRESTAMLVKPTMGHSLQGHPKLKLPLVGSVRL